MDTARQREFTRTVTVETGIQARYSKTRNSIRVVFWYKGVECRETLQLEPTKANIKYAQQLRGTILNAIARNAFSYADYFPDSKKARVFGHVSSQVKIETLLITFLERVKRTQQPSTYTSYRKVCYNHLLPSFGKIPLAELRPKAIRVWIQNLPRTAKTVSNILIPLRAICEEALNDDLIQRNPLDQVVLSKLLNKNTAKSAYAPDPFNLAEIQTLLQHTPHALRPLFQFALFSGLRSSELIALQWADIDWERGLVHVHRAVVERQEKCTKTAAGTRYVVLLPPARQALEDQKAYTLHLSMQVFHNPRTAKPWEIDYQIRHCWKPILKQAGIRYRNPYQTRHTYASLLLSKGENMLWVAKQMGHRDTEMIMKTYGKWIPDTHSTAGYQTAYPWHKVLHSDLP